jgi:DNA-binding CsgD family transcriptional regulator
VAIGEFSVSAPGAVVGRGVELDAISALLRGDSAELRGVLLEGEPGIGKSVLWEAGAARAGQLGHRVLRCRPAETEIALPFAALGDLLAPVLEETLPQLPAPQRLALEIALHRAAPVESPNDQLAVSRAVLAVLRATPTRTTVLAIDDVQWLDEPTAQALEFAFRRLTEWSLRLLLARRTDRALPVPLGLDRIERVTLGPLSLGELGAMLRKRLGLALSRPRLAELHAACGGNPFYALELARSAPLDGFRVPQTLAGAIEARLNALPPSARDAVLLASAAGQATAPLLERTAGSTAGLEQAIVADVLALDGSRVRFTHPLLARVAYDSETPWARRRAHIRLAAAAEGEERARNLALGTEHPDEEVAAELEDAATAAAARGGTDAAASLAEHAARLTPAGSGATTRRLVAAAEHHMAAGDLGRAGELLEELVARLEPGPERARVLLVLARTRSDNALTIRACEQALAEAAGDAAVLSAAHSALGTFKWVGGHGGRCLEHYAAAIRHAESAGDVRAVAIASGWLCLVQAIHGVPWDRRAMERALELEQEIDDFPKWTRPSFQLGTIAAYTDDPDRARPLLQAELARLDARGEVGSRWTVLSRIAESELRCGNWSVALRAAREATELVGQTGFENEVSLMQAILALVVAHLGDLESAQELASQALAVAEDHRLVFRVARAQGSLGFIALSRGDAEQALAHLTPARERLVAAEFGDFAAFAVVENELEALVEVGRFDETEAVAAHVAEVGERADRFWHRAVAARGRALLAAARGDDATARHEVARALAAHERLPNPFELGRTLLAQGMIERRAKRRGEARAALTRALEVFDQLGAPLWAEKAASELARIPGRAPAASELTETERRIAELVASGLANKEVAARLFVTVRTVEGNLTRIYAKLGVRSRTELAALLAGQPVS